jgi:hypothetical protein
MSDQPSRRLLSTGTALDPILAAAAPHDPALAEEVGRILLDDVAAVVAAVPPKERLTTLPIPEQQAILRRLEQAHLQVQDAEILVAVARAETRQ